MVNFWRNNTVACIVDSMAIIDFRGRKGLAQHPMVITPDNIMKVSDANLLNMLSSNPYAKTSILGKRSKSGLIEV